MASPEATPPKQAMQELLELMREMKHEHVAMRKDIESLKQVQLRGGRSDNCYGCGQTGHFIRNCPTNDELRKATSIRAGDPTTRWVTR